MRLLLGSIAAIMMAAPAAGQSTLANSRDRLMTGPTAWQLTPGSITETWTRLSRALRLRIDAPRPGQPRLVRLQQRYATAMIDLFPLDGQGFRLSAGLRYHVRRDFIAEGDGVARGLLFAPRVGSGGARRMGLNRFNPAATVGYTETLGDHWSIGVEMGERKGRAFVRGPRMPGWGAIRSPGLRGQDDGFRPVASLLVGVTF